MLPPHARYALSGQVLTIALRCASRIGLAGETAEDCALSFVARVLIDHEEAALRPPETRHLTGTLHAPWTAKAALRHALNFRRHQWYIQAHEVPWPVSPGSEPQPGWEREAWGYTGSTRGVEVHLMRRLVLETVRAGVRDLAEGPRELVRLYHFEDVGIERLAALSGRSRNAVDQALLRARRQLGTYLSRRGWSADDLRFHLAASGQSLAATPGVSDAGAGYGGFDHMEA